MRIDACDSVAVAIDYQEKLLPAMNEKDTLLKNSEILLSGLKELDVPIVFTQQYTKGLGMTERSLMEAAGTKEYEEKISFSAKDVIAPHIQGKKFVIICGIESHICVLQTAIDLKEQGYQPVLVEDCLSSRTAHNKMMALERAKQEGILLTTYESVLFELLKEAGTSKSKVIQKLIK